MARGKALVCGVDDAASMIPSTALPSRPDLPCPCRRCRSPPPAPFAAAPPPAFGAFGGAGAAGAAGGAWRGYSRPGFRTSSLVLPFAAGALAGGALATLTANPNAYCNGGSLACYRNTCQGALSRCPETNATTVVATSCPDPRFTECWQSPDGAFQCFGRRRPRFGNEDIEAYCSAPEVTQLGPMRSGALAAQAAAAPVRVAAAAVAVLIGAGALAL